MGVAVWLDTAECCLSEMVGGYELHTGRARAARARYRGMGRVRVRELPEIEGPAYPAQKHDIGEVSVIRCCRLRTLVIRTPRTYLDPVQYAMPCHLQN